VACSRSIPVAGRVLDGRTRRPVVGAEVRSGALRALSAEDGRFKLGDVEPDKRVVVSAPRYRTKRLRPSESLLVQLEQLQAVIEVTSGLTGEGLSAKIDGPYLVEKTESGAFRVYGAGPGDTVRVGAFAHEQVPVRIDEGGRAKAVLQAVRVDPASVFSMLRGFIIGDVPLELAGVQGQLEARIRADPRSFAGSNPATAVRLLGQGTNGAVVMAVAVEPSFMARPQVLANFAQSLATGTRSAAEQRILDGEIVYTGDSQGGFEWLAFDRYSVFLAVFGTDDLFVEGVAQAIMAQLS
jgi:hypothetical protein